MSEQDLKKIKGFGNGCLNEVKAKLAEYGIENARGNDREPPSTNDLSRFKKKSRLLKPQLASNRPCLNDKLKEQLTMFVESLDWPSQYKQYHHDGDSWENGFYNIVELEKDITEHLALGYFTRKDVVKIARWERPNAKDRITCPAILRLDVKIGRASCWEIL